MRSFTAIILLIVLLPSCALAGKIYGIIKEGGKPVRPGVEVKITTISDKPKLVARSQTDRNGLYRLYVRETGKFNLTVRDTLHHKGDDLSITVRSYQKSVRYNLVIQMTEKEKAKPTKFILRRE
jgi:hypothetical protein